MLFNISVKLNEKSFFFSTPIFFPPKLPWADLSAALGNGCAAPFWGHLGLLCFLENSNYSLNVGLLLNTCLQRHLISGGGLSIGIAFQTQILKGTGAGKGMKQIINFS